MESVCMRGKCACDCTSSAQPSNKEKKGSDHDGAVVDESDLPVPWRLKLFVAASSGNHERLEELLCPSMASEEADKSAVLVVTTEDNSALHVVATDGDKRKYLKSAEVIHGKAKQLLLARNKHGDTPLHCAARAGNTHMVSRLIELARGDGTEAAMDMVRAQNKDGRTALHEAIGSDDMKMVEAMMSVDNELARVDAEDGTSPLFLAISLGHHRIALELHRNDDGLSYSGNEGRNALHAAVLHSNWIAKELLDWNKKNMEQTKYLAEQRDRCGNTPMHFAASAEDPSLQFFLFAFVYKSLEINSFSLYYDIVPSKLLYKFFVWRKHPMFLLAKADPSSAFQPDKNGLFPVHVAALAGSLVPIIILLNSCPPGCARLRNAQGMTFLHVAVQKERLNIVRFVCNGSSEFKSIVNIQDKEGNTALHIAVLGGNWDIFRTLIGNRHVVLNLANKKGETPMDIAETKAPSASGFNFGMHARRRILGSLTFTNAQNGNGRRDNCCVLKEQCDESDEDKKITNFAQIVGIGSVLVATATFAAAFTMPGLDKKDGNKLVGGLDYAFDGFVISNSLAFICSSLATFSLIYTGVAALDIQKRIELVSFSLALLIGAARSFCAAFAFALYVTLAPLDRKAAIFSCTMTVLALLDVMWFMRAILTDTALVFKRGWVKLKNNKGWGSLCGRLLRLGTRFLANIAYLFWPYIIIFSFLEFRRKFTGHYKSG